MVDETTTIAQLKEMVAAFVHERDWEQYHSPKSLSMNLSVEAAELMEKFLWIDNAESRTEINKNRQEIEDELADVLMSVLCFANAAKIDISKAFNHKLALTAAKYPIEKSKGEHTKYTKL
jgi:NTP pyrophosphatase (non-canonical NTP hydrolase)